MTQKQLLISGGSGFVGRNVINDLLLNRPDIAITNFDRRPLDLNGVVNIVGDAKEFALGGINGQFDYIIHLLALSNDAYCKDFDEAQMINIDFTKQLLDFSMAQTKLKKFIHMSSIILYDANNIPPVGEKAATYQHYTNYSFTKGIAENYVNHYIEKFNFPAIIFRLSNIYGPHQNFINTPFLVPGKIYDALSGKHIEVFNDTPCRDWIYSEDAARAVVQSLDVSDHGIFNLASGKPTSVAQIMSEISNQLNTTYTSLNRETSGPTNLYCDISKITDALQWHPRVDIEEGLEKTIRYIRDNMKDL